MSGYKAAAIFALLCLCLSGFMVKLNKDRDIPRNEVKASEPARAANTEAREEIAEITDVSLPDDKRTKAAESAASVSEIKEFSQPDLLKVGRKYFYLFNENVLVPVEAGEWKEYRTNGGDGYGPVAKYYLADEKPDAWTQEFAMHEVKSDEDCFAFTEKLVNGVIVSLETKAGSKELTQENLLFSFVKKEPDDVILFWHKKNIPGTEDDVQFLRCFLAKNSGKKYLSTLTFKIFPDELKKEDIEEYVRVLTQVQELVEKKGE